MKIRHENYVIFMYKEVFTVVEINILLSKNLTTLQIFHCTESQSTPTNTVTTYRGLEEKIQKSGQWKAFTLKDISHDGEDSRKRLFN
jgi:hypothetical protein